MAPASGPVYENEIAETIYWVTEATGHSVRTGKSPWPVEIDHDRREILINERLSDHPPYFQWYLVRAYRRIVGGPDVAPEFRPKLRLVR